MHNDSRPGLMWFRRDLRTQDNTALQLARGRCAQVHCVFVFDTTLLGPLPRQDRRVEFIVGCVAELDAALRAESGDAAGGLIVLHGDPAQLLPRLAQELQVGEVFANEDYEPAAIARDGAVRTALSRARIGFALCKDQVLFAGRELLTQAGQPYSVFTPYKRAWLARLQADGMRHDPPTQQGPLARRPEAYRRPPPSLADLGFAPTNLAQLPLPVGASGARQLLEDFVPRMADYREARDFPAVKGPSYLSVHLRFGTVSVRTLIATALAQGAADGNAGAATWLSELAWRDFYFQILANFPHVATGSFRPEYDAIGWEQGAEADRLFAAWCEGRTGYPLVDAAMLQLNTTGYMHNRLRMVTASFLCKDLGLDWRWGERYFAEKLNDYDLAANNGGWQWASSSGCDAQPYFRIFNPVSQSEKFDAAGKFILRYLPQLAGLPAAALHAPWLARPVDLAAAGVELGRHYPRPIVDHAEARERTLRRYAVVKAARAAH